MKKFTSYARQKPAPLAPAHETLYQGKYLSVVNVDSWEAIQEPDCVIIIPYFPEFREFLIRKETVPTYQAKTGQSKFLTMISGGIKPGEEPTDALARELEEEAGIRLSTSYQSWKLLGKLFFSKGSLAQYHIYYVPLHVGDFQKFSPRGDGSAEEATSSTVRVDNKYLDSLKVSDAITALSLEYLKKELGN